MKNHLKIIIIEDDPSVSLELEMAINKLGHNLLATADNSGDALIEILDKKPDLILMDIEIIGKLSGIEIAEKVSHLNIPIIFITSFANDKHYDQAEQIDNTTYLIKPVDQYTLKSAINLLIKTSHTVVNNFSKTDYDIRKGDIYLKRKNEFYKINYNEIVIIQSDRVYCKTILVDGNAFHNRITLIEYAVYLNSPNFIKPHRSYIVNTDHIKKVNINENLIIMNNDRTVPISRTAKNEIKTLMKMIN